VIRRVIDTNVLVVANGRDTNARIQCRLAAGDALNGLLRNGRIVVDEAREMQTEYRTYCDPKGQPGVGDRFYREVLNNYGGKVERIFLAKREDGSFEDFPDDPALHQFDPSDRKFAAAARKSGAAVMSCTDTDWVHHADALRRHGIEVDFLCGTDPTIWIAS
jgi:hypothetical protein